MELVDFREVLKKRHHYYQKECKRNIGWEGQDYKEWLESEIHGRDKEIRKLQNTIDRLRYLFKDNIMRIFGSDDE